MDLSSFPATRYSVVEPCRGEVCLFIFLSKTKRSPLTPTFPTSSSLCDVLVVGGGIVGLDTALRMLQSRPQLRLVLLEKESHLACHQRVK